MVGDRRPGEVPSFADFIEEYDATIKDLRDAQLPFAQLKRKLEQDWPAPEAGSITIDLLASALTYGVASVTWAGVLRTSNVLTVQHGLNRQPTEILFGSSSANVHPSWSNLTPTTFDLTGNTIDGSVPAAATTRPIGWLAL